MTCVECRAALIPLMNGEVVEAELPFIWTHLRECSGCSRECARIVCLRALLEHAQAPEPPRNLWERVEVALSSVASETAANGPSDMLTPSEAAQYLRVRTTDVLASLDVIPHLRIGDAIRLRKQALDRWLEEQEGVFLRPPRDRSDGKIVELGNAQARLSRVGRR